MILRVKHYRCFLESHSRFEWTMGEWIAAASKNGIDGKLYKDFVSNRLKLVDKTRKLWKIVYDSNSNQDRR